MISRRGFSRALAAAPAFGYVASSQAQDNYHYATLINRLQVLYDTRFAQI